MDHFIHQIQALSSTSDDLRQLKTILNKNSEQLDRFAHSFDDTLSTLDPERFTLGWLFILHSKISMKCEGPNFIQQALRLIKEASTFQISLVPHKFTRVCNRLTDLAISQGNPLLAVRPLQLAIQKIQPSSNGSQIHFLTPIHADFLQVCLLSKTYSVALHVLSEQAYEIDAPYPTRDFLRFLYYGGMIFTGLKQFPKALEFFKQAFAIPAKAVSKIMIESYKKHSLISLLVHGQVPPTPKYASGSAVSNFSMSCKPYSEFVTSYSTSSVEDLQKTAANHLETFQKDGNYGLVKQCIKSLYKRNIQKLTKTYLTLSLNDIASSVNLPSAKEAEKAILRMIEDGEISATINQKEGMVSFHENTQNYNSVSTLQILNAHLHSLIEVTNKLQKVDEAITSNQQYLTRSLNQERGKFLSDLDEYDGDKPSMLMGMVGGGPAGLGFIGAMRS